MYQGVLRLKKKNTFNFVSQTYWTMRLFVSQTYWTMVVFFGTHFGKFWHHLIPFTFSSTEVLIHKLNFGVKMKQNRMQVNIQAHGTVNVQNLESRIRTSGILLVCFTLGTSDTECGFGNSYHLHIVFILFSSLVFKMEFPCTLVKQELIFSLIYLFKSY